MPALGAARRCELFKASRILVLRSLWNDVPSTPLDAIEAFRRENAHELRRAGQHGWDRLRRRERGEGRACHPCVRPLGGGSSVGTDFDRRYSTSQWNDQEKSRNGSSKRPIVAVGMSGGVDSSLAALILQRQGYEVFGLYMHNWDARDEAGGGHCTADRDYEDAQRVCKHLGINLHLVDYQKQYWTEVFETFTQKFAMGLTPNPDLACNQYIKFDALLEQALEMGADKLATGHYARLQLAQSGGPVQLLRGIDHSKDQSYFLASVSAAALERVLFPLGMLTKSKVRELAVLEGLVTATKRSSAGICFVGRRDFRDFISEYVEMKPGRFVSVETNGQLGMHTGIAAYTHGQRAGISGVPKAFYVVGKDMHTNIVFVAPGAEHPALFCNSAVAGDAIWISGAPPQALKDGQPFSCMFKARYGQAPEGCTVCFSDSRSDAAITQGMGVAGFDSTEFTSSTFCRLHSAIGGQKQQLQVRFAQPTRAITPGQALVLYDGDVCLGASVIATPGPSCFEQSIANQDKVHVHHSRVSCATT